MFFFDTYALVEVIRGSPSYVNYRDQDFVTTKLNLMELYYVLLRKEGEKTASMYYDAILKKCVAVKDSTIKRAMKFRMQQRSERNLISYVDCVGYIVALENNIRFLTGEKHFTELPNVEFVK